MKLLRLLPFGCHRTAANALTLATLAKPWDTIFCTSLSHINEDECNAQSYLRVGQNSQHCLRGINLGLKPCKRRLSILLVAGARSATWSRIFLTQVSEKGTVYTLDEIDVIVAIAKAYGMPVHMDGARFANALIALNCSPAEMTWKRGIDALSFPVLKMV